MCEDIQKRLNVTISIATMDYLASGLKRQDRRILSNTILSLAYPDSGVTKVRV